jgi:CheY-like chemotaxis protein
VLLSTKYDGMPRKLPSFAFLPAQVFLACCALDLADPASVEYLTVSSALTSGINGLLKLCAKSTMTKILIVEDDDFLADLMRDCLAASSYDVSSVGTGVEALQQLESESFTIVLLDWQLPDMEGLDVLKTYKENNGKAKVVMLTGMRGRKDDVMESGADGFLTKPVKMNDILATVKQLATGA